MKHMITTAVPIEIAASFIATATAGSAEWLGCLTLDDQVALNGVAAVDTAPYWDFEMDALLGKKAEISRRFDAAYLLTNDGVIETPEASGAGGPECRTRTPSAIPSAACIKILSRQIDLKREASQLLFAQQHG